MRQVTRQILCPEDLDRFLESKTFSSFLSFIQALNESVRGKALPIVPAENSIEHRLERVRNELTNAVTDTEHSHYTSSSAADILVQEFLLETNSATTMEEEGATPDFIRRLDNLLILLIELAQVIEPLAQHEGRFGNPSFRVWLDFVTRHSESLVGSLFSNETRNRLGVNRVHVVVREQLVPYFMSAFGNRQRIDYGTGNEALFMAFLYCCCAEGSSAVEEGEENPLALVPVEHYELLVSVIFKRYLQLMRMLQFRYWLEPAGSHGVWGLDDYHFLPFLFGSSQLLGHRYIKPKSIHDPEVIEAYSKRYFYLSCIQFVNQVKNASLRWHSPMLDDISSAKSWEKINTGLLKMYCKEVLGKYPIMQHFLFGPMIPFTSIVGGERIAPVLADSNPSARNWTYMYEVSHEEVCEHRMPGELPSCCVIKVPSAIASTGSQGGFSVKRTMISLPFD